MLGKWRCREWRCQELTEPTGRAAPHRHSHPLKCFLCFTWCLWWGALVIPTGLHRGVWSICCSLLGGRCCHSQAAPQTQSVFLLSLSLHVIWEGGRHWLHLGVQHCCYRDSCIYQHTRHGLFKLPLHGIVRVWWLLQHLKKVKLNSIQVGGSFVI